MKTLLHGFRLICDCIVFRCIGKTGQIVVDYGKRTPKHPPSITFSLRSPYLGGSDIVNMAMTGSYTTHFLAATRARHNPKGQPYSRPTPDRQSKMKGPAKLRLSNQPPFSSIHPSIPPSFLFWPEQQHSQINHNSVCHQNEKNKPRPGIPKMGHTQRCRGYAPQKMWFTFF